MNGKGSRPRNNFTQVFRDNYDAIFMPRKMTANDGAAQTRAAILRKITRMKRDADKDVSVALGELAQWVRDMDVRSGKKKGGLGRR